MSEQSLKFPSWLFKSEPEVNDEPFVVYSSLESRQVYRWLADQEQVVREKTRSAHNLDLHAWQESIGIRIVPFLPGQDLELPEVIEGDIRSVYCRFSQEFRIYMLANSIATSKSILEAVMSGQYAQAFVLQRVAFEGWKRIFYARIRPEDVLRWIPIHWLCEYQEFEGYQRCTSEKPSAADWTELASKLVDKHDISHLELGNFMMKTLDAFVHPSLEGATQLFLNQERDRPNVSALCSEVHAYRCLRNLIFVEWLYQYETLKLEVSSVPKQRILQFLSDKGELRRRLDAHYEHMNAVEKQLGIERPIHTDETP